MGEWWRYKNLEPVKPGQGWHEASSQGDHPDDNIDFHVDLGCGYIPKARLGIDRSENADIQMNLETGEFLGGNQNDLGPYFLFGHKEGWVLPFENNSIESIISHHFFEHLSSDAFIDLIDDCYRVLVPEGKLRIIVPMFPSFSAFESSDHKMLLSSDSFTDFWGREGQEHWHESFAKPYTKARFRQTAMDYTPATQIGVSGDFFTINGEKRTFITIDDILPKSRELRVTLQK
jgi:SAM-dependent methyltransferase